MHADILIIGAGPAGFNAAKAASPAGKKIILAGSEPVLPYWRPRLPDIIGNGARPETILLKESGWYQSAGIEVLLKKHAERIDPAAKTVVWDDDSSTEYEELILACGAASNIPDYPYTEHILVLRTYEDALRIKAECAHTGKAFIIGGGVLGLETAFAVAGIGCSVCVSDISEYPLPRQLDREGGLFLKKKLEERGITIKGAESPEKLRNDIEGACVIAAAGVKPSVKIAAACGIKTNRGIIVDSRMQTSVEHIYACGDVAEFPGSMSGLMPIASGQGKIAGLNAAGTAAVYQPVIPSPMLKVAGISVLSVGSMEISEAAQIYRLSDTESYAAAVVTAGKLTGASFIGNTAVGQKFKKKMESDPEIGPVSSFKDIMPHLN